MCAFDPSDDQSLADAFNRIWRAGIRLGIVVGAVIASCWCAAFLLITGRI